MTRLLSNQLKAIVFAGDMTENSADLVRAESSTVLEYFYECNRTRNKMGIPYGNVHSSVLKFKIRNFSDKTARAFIESMHKNNPHDFSFVFNAVFDDYRRLKDYDDAFIARGYVIDAKETYDNYQEGRDIQGQRTLEIAILLAKITYLGNYNNQTILITND